MLPNDAHVSMAVEFSSAGTSSPFSFKFDGANIHSIINSRFEFVGNVPDGIRRIPTTYKFCLLYTSPSPRDRTTSRMPSSA